MHLCSCENPQKIFNPYLKEYQIVPCGKCAPCLNRRTLTITNRLDVERKCWKYCLFFTLTYDNEFLPILTRQDFYLTDLSPKRVHPILGVKSLNLTDAMKKGNFSADDVKNSYEYIDRCCSHFGGLPYLCSVDVQRFMKRFRSTITRFYNSHLKSIQNAPKLSKVRYYISGEYGPSTFRPHYHGLLFFNETWLSSNIEQFVRQSWQLGSVDTSFCESSNSSYVAKYLNSISHLPAIYKVPALRPFQMFSKHPAIGTLLDNSNNIKEMFLSGTLVQTMVSDKSSKPVSMPLWRTYRDKLYPKLANFSKLSHLERVQLYGLYNRLGKENCYDFIYTLKYRCRGSFIKDYITYLDSYKGDLNQKLQRLFAISSRVCMQAQVFDVTINEYVERIEKFYDDIQKTNLRAWYTTIEGIENFNPCVLAGVDGLFLERFRELDIGNLDLTEIEYLRSLGIDLDKFFSEDLPTRYAYQSMCLPSASAESKIYFADQNRILDNSTKTKRKNDYLHAVAGYEINHDDYYSYLLNVPF